MEIDSGDKYAFSKLYKDRNFTDNYRSNVLNKVIEMEEFASFCLHQIFRDEAFRGKRILDVGCGPTVHRMAAPSKYFSEIVLSDYTQHNRKAVQEWLKDESSSKDWDTLMRMEALLEGYGNVEEGINEIKLRLRQKIKEVIPCDVLQKDIISSDVGKFDALFTSLCLEGACATLEDYKTAVKNFGNYILPNGGFVMVSVLECSYYYLGNNEKLPSLFVTREFVNETLKEAGFVKKHCFFMENDQQHPVAKFSGYLISSAIKSV
ncbi:nicotinamide N-methyltransferase-like isoform X1 [Centruroides sculpturatus]|uniref:nicotinamide N-methyltransferase-like isoform X1 n=1 Tax=Centruroides sculpturatus TaxID=218467 RepID=UPI000C6E367F|nr:nicotinamide N-methyltransferase-like isoform X1 [Centruroides sculpturatus]